MDELTDRAFAKILGREIRLAREARGWTREQLCEQLPSGIGDRTLLSYEHGIRHLTVARLLEISRSLDESGADVLRRAMEKASDLSGHTFRVNLRAVKRDKRMEFAPVRLWAARRLQETSNPDLLLAPSAVREMAAVLGFAHEVLAAYLAEFAVATEGGGE